MNIIDIFYNEVVNEAKDGIGSILFDTYMEEKHLLISGECQHKDIFKPVLRINNKSLFDELLCEYVVKALEFYQDSTYLNIAKSNANILNKDANLEKIVLKYLWYNATFEDFQNPVRFLERRIAFLDSTLGESYNNYGNIPMFHGNLTIEILKDEIYNETPYMMAISLKNDSGKTYLFPEIKFGIENDTVYFYAIENCKLKKSSYLKKVNRILDNIDNSFTELDIKELYDIEKIKNIKSSVLIGLNIAITYFNNLGYNKIVASSILLPRINAKEIEHEEDLIKNELLSTFLRLTYHFDGIDVISYPLDVDSNLHLRVSDDIKCNPDIFKLPTRRIKKR